MSRRNLGMMMEGYLCSSMSFWVVFCICTAGLTCRRLDYSLCFVLSHILHLGFTVHLSLPWTSCKRDLKTDNWMMDTCVCQNMQTASSAGIIKGVPKLLWSFFLLKSSRNIYSDITDKVTLTCMDIFSRHILSDLHESSLNFVFSPLRWSESSLLLSKLFVRIWSFLAVEVSQRYF